MDRKFRLPRVWSNSELRKIAAQFNGKVINVSAGDNIDKEGSTYDNYFYNATEFWTSNYSPGSYRGYMGKEKELLIDLEKELNAEWIGKFDVVFNHTTLEHIFDVFTAFRNTCLLSKDIVITVVPFAQEQHENPGYKDFWRFTPTCIRQLFAKNGLEVIYESANNEFNTATYLFFVASKFPGKWGHLMPVHTKIHKAASWIGNEVQYKGNAFFSKMKNFLKR